MTPTEQNPTQSLLHNVLRYRTQEELAGELGVNTRTLRRWIVGEARPKLGYLTAIQHLYARDERPNRPEFTFIDLFAGIGGLRRAFEGLNGRCVFTCEWDKYAAKTYKANYPDAFEIAGDIRSVNLDDIESHDLLLAGFPCQPFSLAGVSKKNSLGRAHGFLDETQGTLFFNIVSVLRAHQPKAFLLENVKNLRSHDRGRTFNIILGSLRELGYQVHFQVVDSTPWVPQRRERIYLVGFKEPTSFDWSSLVRPKVAPTLRDILHSVDEEPEAPYTFSENGRTVVDPRYTLSDHLWKYLQDYAAKHRAKGNGFGCSVFGPDDVTRTLSARYHKDGSEILIDQGSKMNPRRLTPRECARIMGFDSPKRSPLKIPVSDTQAYRQFGNSVAVPVIEAIARELVPRMLRPHDFPVSDAAQIQTELLLKGRTPTSDVLPTK